MPSGTPKPWAPSPSPLASPDHLKAQLSPLGVPSPQLTADELAAQEEWTSRPTARDPLSVGRSSRGQVLSKRSEWLSLGTTRTLRARDVIPTPPMVIKRYRNERWASYDAKASHLQQPSTTMSSGGLASGLPFALSMPRQRREAVPRRVLDGAALIFEGGGRAGETDPADLHRVIVSAERGGYHNVEEEGFEAFSGLSMVDCSGNALPLTPFGALPALQELILACNSMQLVAEIAPGRSFLRLTTLDLSFNMLTEASIGELAQVPLLSTLKLKCNGLEAMPRNLDSFVQLTDLDLSQNSLSMPQTFRDLLSMKRMRVLDLSENAFDRVPTLDTARASSVVQDLRLHCNRFATFASVERLVALTLLDKVTLHDNLFCTGRRVELEVIQSALSTGVWNFKCLLEPPSRAHGGVAFTRPAAFVSLTALKLAAMASPAARCARREYDDALQRNVDSWSAVNRVAMKRKEPVENDGWTSPVERAALEAVAIEDAANELESGVSAGFFMTAETEWKKPQARGTSKTSGMGLLSEEQIRRNFFAECKQLLPGQLPRTVERSSSSSIGLSGQFREMPASKLKATLNHMRHCLKHPITVNDPSVPIANFGVPTQSSRRKRDAAALRRSARERNHSDVTAFSGKPSATRKVVPRALRPSEIDALADALDRSVRLVRS